MLIIKISIQVIKKQPHWVYLSPDRAENSKIKSPVKKHDPIDRFSVID